MGDKRFTIALFVFGKTAITKSLILGKAAKLQCLLLESHGIGL